MVRGLLEGRYPLPNYRPRFLALSAHSLFLPPPIFEGHRPPPQNSNIINTKLSTKVIQGLLHSFLYKECHVFNKIEGIKT